MKKTTIFSHFFNVFTRVFGLKMLKHAFKRIKNETFERFLLTLGTAIVSETRSLFLDFAYFSMRLNAFLKNFVCLGTNFKTCFRLNPESFRLEKDYDGLASYLTATV